MWCLKPYEIVFRMSKEAIANAGVYAKSIPDRAAQNARSVLYNAMVAPWDRFAVRAALWYQVIIEQLTVVMILWNHRARLMRTNGSQE